MFPQLPLIYHILPNIIVKYRSRTCESGAIFIRNMHRPLGIEVIKKVAIYMLKFNASNIIIFLLNHGNVQEYC